MTNINPSKEYLLEYIENNEDTSTRVSGKALLKELRKVEDFRANSSTNYMYSDFQSACYRFTNSYANDVTEL